LIGFERSPLKRKILQGQKKSGIHLRMSNMATTKSDIADYLDNEEMIAEYLNTVLEDGTVQTSL
jgi:hypothetical protein